MRQNIAVVVVHFHSQETLRFTLADLAEHIPPDRIFVVDNSRDLIAPSWSSLATIIVPPTNLGYAAAVNLGFRSAITSDPLVEDVLVCTHETRFTDDALEKLFSSAAGLEPGHVVAPRLVHTEADGIERVWSEGGRLSFPFFYPAHIRRVRPGTPRLRPVLWVDGAAFIMDVVGWQRADGIPEDFFVYIEDVALGLRCRRRGIAVVVDSGVTVSQSANGPSRSRAVRNRLLLAARYMNPFQRAIVFADCWIRGFLLRISRDPERKARGRESRAIMRELRSEGSPR